MKCYDILGVYLVDFKINIGGELRGKHYAVILTPVYNDKTMLVAPITSKKSGKKYRGGFTIDCKKYQKNPTYDKAFVKIRKIREVDRSRVYKSKIYSLDNEDIEKMRESIKKVFNL